MTALIVLIATAAGVEPADARGPIEIEYQPTADRVLGLYDSTDKSKRHKTVILNKRVRAALASLELGLELHDVNEGLPSAAKMTRYRAIITAFDDETMTNAGEYLSWLHRQMRNNRRVIILDNLGAFREAADEKWIEWDSINRVTRLLGVIYDAKWTDNPENLRIVERDDSVFRGSGPSVEQAKHYYRFAPAGDITAHLVVERTDIKDGKSAVVFTSRHGGLALTRYYESDGGTEYIDLKAFLERGLYPQGKHSTRILFVVDPESSAGHRMEKNLHWIVRYGHLQADFVHMRDLTNMRRRDLAAYGSVVLASYDGGLITEGSAIIAGIERWVREDGGGLVALFPVRVPGWDRMFGIRNFSERTQNVDGVRFGGGFFPGLEDLLVHGDGYGGKQEINRISLANDAAVLARGARKGSEWKGPPIMWKRRHGQGRVLYRADSAFTQKVWRGSVLQMVLQSMPVAAAPIVNALVYYVDDCPMPMWNTQKQPIKGEYKLTDTDFYKNVWWPDLMRMAKRFSLRLTFVLIFSYDDKTDNGFTTDPFYADSGKGVPMWMAREAVRLGHEVGLHGYNHQSLVRQAGKTSVGWPSREAMYDALALARKEWRNVFGPGNAPFTYIAPNNHIHRAGKEALKAAFPEIRVLSAQYLNEGDIEGQEFDVDPDVSHFMDLPRVSSEFYTGAHNNLPMIDAVMLLGVWSHFVHPDDVYDPERNGGMGWKGLKTASNSMLKHMRMSYPWLRSLTARDAYNELVGFSSGSFHYEHGPNRIRVHLGDGTHLKSQFVVHADPGVTVTSVTNGRVIHSYPEFGYYYMEGRGPITTVHLSQ